MAYRETEGDLIAMAGDFEVIGQGVNCFNTQKSGLAPQMVRIFKTDRFPMELTGRGDISKLGQIDCLPRQYLGEYGERFSLVVVNCYTQYNYGMNHSDGSNRPLDYEALTLCMRKMNHMFKGKHIGLPQIGCGLAGGSWDRVKEIIKTELKDCDVTVVIYNK